MVLTLFSLFAHKIENCDIWWHLKAGELIHNSWTIPQTDPFSLVSAGGEWIDLHWLFQLVSYELFNMGAATALTLFYFFLLCLSLYLLFLSVKDKACAMTTLFLFLIAILASRERFYIRPETFSIFYLSLTFFLLEGWRIKKNKNYLFLLPFVQVFWVNSHGLFILGLLLIFIYFIASFLDRFRFGNFDKTETFLLGKIFLFSLGACLLNPYFLKGLVFPLELFTRIGPGYSSFKSIDEFTTVFNKEFFNLSVVFYFVLVFMAVVGLLRNFKETKTEHLLIFIGFLFLSLISRRNVILFSFIMAPITARSLSGLARKPLLVSLTVCTYLFLSLGTSLAAMTNYLYYSEKKTREFGFGFSEKVVPIKATQFIKQRGLKGNLFSTMCCAGHGIWTFWPDAKVFFDSRLEVHDKEGFHAYQNMLSDIDYWDRETRRLNIRTTIISHLNSGGLNLAMDLFKSKDWEAKYLDRFFIVFAKSDSKTGAAHTNVVLDTGEHDTAKDDFWGFFGKYHYPVGKIRLANILSLIGQKEKAISLFESILRKNPANSDVLNNLAWELMESKLDMKRAVELSLRSIKNNPIPSYYHTLGMIYLAMDKKEMARDALRTAIRLSRTDAEREKFSADLKGIR